MKQNVNPAKCGDIIINGSEYFIYAVRKKDW